MEWWQIFGLFFLFFVGLFFYSAIAKEADKNKRREEKLLTMGDPYEEGDWQHPDELLQTEGDKSVQRRSRNSEDDENESFVTKLPKAVNQIINQKLTKAGLKDKVEIGKLQVEYITSANEYGDKFFDLENKSKTNRINNLKLDKQILESENDLKDVAEMDSLRELKKQDNRLDIDISIAEKQARLNSIKNPPQPEKELSPKEKKAEERAEVEEQIRELEEAMKKLKEDNSTTSDGTRAQLNQIENKLFELYQRRIDLL